MLTVTITCDFCKAEILRQENSAIMPQVPTCFGDKHMCAACADRVREFLKGAK